MWKDPPFLMGKSTISMAIFNCYFDITRGYQVLVQSVSCGVPLLWSLVEAKASSAAPKKRAANPDEADTAWQPSGDGVIELCDL